MNFYPLAPSLFYLFFIFSESKNKLNGGTNYEMLSPVITILTFVMTEC